MPVDIAAEVIDNHSLSADYNVLALRGAGNRRGRRAGPVRDGEGRLGPRPAAAAALFGLRNPPRPAGAPVGFSLLNKRIGPSTALALRRAARDSASPASDRSAVPSSLVDRPTEAWMVAGGVGLAPFVDARRVATRARRPLDTLLRRATGRASCSIWICSARLDVDLVLTTEDGSAVSAAASSRPLEQRLACARPGRSRHDLRVRSGRHARSDGENRDATTAVRARCRSSGSWGADWAAVTAASCRCATSTVAFTTSARA